MHARSTPYRRICHTRCTTDNMTHCRTKHGRIRSGAVRETAGGRSGFHFLPQSNARTDTVALRPNSLTHGSVHAAVSCERTRARALPYGIVSSHRAFHADARTLPTRTRTHTRTDTHVHARARMRRIHAARTPPPCKGTKGQRATVTKPSGTQRQTNKRNSFAALSLQAERAGPGRAGPACCRTR